MFNNDSHFTNKIPKSVNELDNLSKDAFLQSALRDQKVGKIAVAYTVWSKKKGGGKIGLVNDYERKEYKLTSLETKYGGLLSQGVTFNYKGENLDGLGLNFRIFLISILLF